MCESMYYFYTGFLGVLILANAGLYFKSTRRLQELQESINAVQNERQEFIRRTLRISKNA